MATTKCPNCERKSIQLGVLANVVTTIHRITCPACKAKWQVKVQPVPVKPAGCFLYQLYFVNVSWR